MSEPVSAAADPAVNEMRFKILEIYKHHFVGKKGASNRTPFSNDRVVGYSTPVANLDIPEIHSEVRNAIAGNIADLHKGRSSLAAVFAGEAGSGKSHLLSWFRQQNLQEELGYVYVGNNNSWKIQEFEECLLTWLVASLTKPAIDGTNLLGAKIEEIAFQALEQILDKPGELRHFRPRSSFNWFKRAWWPFGPDRHAHFRQAVIDRKSAIFRSLDFPRFAKFVCDRFLLERSNPFHRYALTVLLRFLFSEDRHMVVAWLVGQKLHDRFLAKLGSDVSLPSPSETDVLLLDAIGIADRLNRNYKIADTIKILVSLFAPDMNRSAANDSGKTGRVFFFAFDQIEGLDELFDDEHDWFTFFAKLSEFYNSLPNVFIVFTMTVGLRNRLYTQMENQFRQRLQRDDRLLLKTTIPDAEVSRLFLRRLQVWRGNHFPEFEAKLQEAAFQYLPFTEAEVWALARQKNIRAMLEVLDQEFRKKLVEQPTRSAHYDYTAKLNEVRDDEARANFQGAYVFSKAHLKTVHSLLTSLSSRWLDALGLQLDGLEWVTTPEGNLTALRIQLSRAGQAKWVRYFLGQMTSHYTTPIANYDKLLSNTTTDRNFLWLVRAETVPEKVQAKIDEKRPGRIRLVHLKSSDAGAFSSDEARLQSVVHLRSLEVGLANLPDITAEEREAYSAEFDQVLREELGQTYLGAMTNHAVIALERLQNGSEASELAASVSGGA